MISRSFVDLMFILLAAAIMLLTQSVQMRGMKCDPVHSKGGESRDITGSGIEVVVISNDWIGVRGKHYEDVQQVLAVIEKDLNIVLVPENDSISHHRVISLWLDLRAAGRHIELGIQPVKEGAPS